VIMNDIDPIDEGVDLRVLRLTDYESYWLP
jgi:hypothetical protein